MHSSQNQTNNYLIVSPIRTDFTTSNLLQRFTQTQLNQAAQHIFHSSSVYKKVNVAKAQTKTINPVKTDQKQKQSIFKRNHVIQEFYNELNTKFKGLLLQKKVAIKRKSLQLCKKSVQSRQLKTVIKQIVQPSSVSILHEVSIFERKRNVNKIRNFQYQQEKYKIFQRKMPFKWENSLNNVNNFEVSKITRLKSTTPRTTDQDEKIIEKQLSQINQKIKQNTKSTQNKIFSLNPLTTISNKSPKKIYFRKLKKNVDTTLNRQNTGQSLFTQDQLLKVQFYNLKQLKYIFTKNEKIIQNFPVKQKKYGQSFSALHIHKNIITTIAYNNPKKISQIASLTKIMTCLLVILMSQKFKINLKSQKVKISHKAAQLKGTSAKLLYLDLISVQDLLYGLMLPSGNDAAVALGQWGGKTINSKIKNCYQTESPRWKSQSKLSKSRRKSNLCTFIMHMNKLARDFKLGNTNFSNVHGLMNKKNYSCSEDLCKLSFLAMQKQEFKKIVNTKTYICKIQNKKFCNERQVVWQNTNKLLRIQNYYGIKTGITPSAGPCLSSCYKISDEQLIIIVLLKSTSPNQRFQQSKNLLMQALRQLYISTNNKLYQNHFNYLNQKIQISDTQAQPEQLNNFQVVDQQGNQQFL